MLAHMITSRRRERTKTSRVYFNANSRGLYRRTTMMMMISRRRRLLRATRHDSALNRREKSLFGLFLVLISMTVMMMEQMVSFIVDELTRVGHWLIEIAAAVAR